MEHVKTLLIGIAVLAVLLGIFVTLNWFFALRDLVTVTFYTVAVLSASIAAYAIGGAVRAAFHHDK